MAITVLVTSCASGETSFSTSDEAIDSQIAGESAVADDLQSNGTTTSIAESATATKAETTTTAPAETTTTQAETATTTSAVEATTAVETTTTQAETATTTSAVEATTTNENTAPPVSGAGVFAANCSSCHAADGSGRVGPDIRDETSSSSVASTVRNGSGRMPSFSAKLTEEEIQAVAAFVTSSL
jgi:mono/diheme cytochrome c family protein